MALDLKDEEKEFPVTNNPDDPLIMLAFKLEDGRYGQLTYIRTYQGTLKKGDTVYNNRTGKKVKIGRLCRMHSDEMQEIESCGSGDIVALFGIDCASGDTFSSDEISCSMTSMHIPEPVISLAVIPSDNKAQINMSKALNRFTKEDPTFKTFVDHETGETIISGMGELHLEVYVERMKREYGAEVEVGAPQVAYRETISQRAEFNYTHKKQTGGSGQFAKIDYVIEPGEQNSGFEFESKVTGGNVPREFWPAVEKGFALSMESGTLAGFPLLDVKITLMDGGFHAVDSSAVAYEIAAKAAYRQSIPKAGPQLLEPIMKVDVFTPDDHVGDVIGDLNRRRGMIKSQEAGATGVRVKADAPLSEMFGYIGDLRTMTSGRGQFSMEFSHYAPCPANVAEAVIKEVQERNK
jgi:elongation factor G